MNIQPSFAKASAARAFNFKLGFDQRKDKIMKTQLLILLSLMLAGMVVPDLFAGDFREADWGMMPTLVKATEKGLVPVVDNEVGRSKIFILGLKYNGTLGGSPATISYFFSQGKLVRGEYSIASNILKSSSGIYLTIRNGLAEKYGQPLSEEEKRSDDFLRITLGKEVTWRTDRTAIVLSTKEPEGSITLTYTDRKYRDISAPKTLGQEL